MQPHCSASHLLQPLRVNERLHCIDQVSGTPESVALAVDMTRMHWARGNTRPYRSSDHSRTLELEAVAQEERRLRVASSRACGRQHSGRWVPKICSKLRLAERTWCNRDFVRRLSGASITANGFRRFPGELFPAGQPLSQTTSLANTRISILTLLACLILHLLPLLFKKMR